MGKHVNFFDIPSNFSFNTSSPRIQQLNHMVSKFIPNSGSVYQSSASYELDGSCDKVIST